MTEGSPGLAAYAALLYSGFVMAGAPLPGQKLKVGVGK